MKFDFKSERHTKYKDYQDMYDNFEDETLQVRKLGSTMGAYIPISLPREIVHLYSDLAFSTPVNAFLKENTEADKSIDELIESNKLNMLLSEASLTQAVKGGVVLKTYLDEGEVKITYIQPDFYFPEFSISDRRKVVRETIAYKLDEETTFTETYEPRNGEYWCITRILKGKKNAVHEEKEINTRLKMSPLEYVPFVRSGSSYWGDSIYNGLIPLFDELNHRVTQISNILDKHSDPNMYADESFFEADGTLKSGGQAYPVDYASGEQPPGYITWDWSAEANFRFIEDIIYKSLHYVSPLAPALYGLDSSSQSSGTALRLKSWRTQCLVSRSHMYWVHALKKVLYIAQQLQIISGEKSYKPEVPNVELKIKLPSDVMEQAQAEQLKIQAGLTSKKSAIARLNPHYTSAEIEAEYQEILSEEAEALNNAFVRERV